VDLHGGHHGRHADPSFAADKLVPPTSLVEAVPRRLAHKRA